MVGRIDRGGVAAGAARGGGRRRGGGGAARRMMRRGLHRRGLARDADAAIAVLHLDLGQVGLVEQFGELADERGIDLHRAVG